MKSNQESILVCGSGIAGLASAVGLTKAGFNVSVLGPKNLVVNQNPDNWHPRVYAISPSSQQFLADIGIWGLLNHSRVTTVESMQVYGDASGHVDLQSWHGASSALAWIIESGEIERALQQALQVYGITWHDDKFDSIQSNAVITESGSRINFDLLIGADGALSKVRTESGIYHDKKMYGDNGVVCHLTTQYAHQNTAMQWFCGDSILALLPLADTSQGHQMSMVWSMPESQAHSLLALDTEAQSKVLYTKLQSVTVGVMGNLSVRSKLFSFPLTIEKTDMVAPSIALVGDAAHRVHPLAGQGLNLGLGDVNQLISTLKNKEKWYGVGDIRVLQRYKRARANPIMAMRTATHALHQLFNIKSAPIVHARNLGMSLANNLPPLKRFLINGAK